jgi:hypothetical protein
MNRTLAIWMLCMAWVGCGGSTSPIAPSVATDDRPGTADDRPTIHVGGIHRVPVDLVSEAAYLRSIRGVVVRAVLRQRNEVFTRLAPLDAPPGSGNQLARDFAISQFAINDALGENVGPTVLVRAPIGDLRLVDPAGRPVPVVISSDEFLREQIYMPESGEFVLFLGPPQSDGSRVINWRAVITDGLVTGVNTVRLRDEALDSLRVP